MYKKEGEWMERQSFFIYTYIQINWLNTISSSSRLACPRIKINRIPYPSVDAAGTTVRVLSGHDDSAPPE